ncbi:MAG: DUF1223 domain-containing protein [Acidiferrobacterales bacterium]
MRLLSLFMTGVLLLPAYAHAAKTTECSAASGNRKVALLELYTSEGCSSCPPADKWLRELPLRGLTADRVIPLALHVDYWNYLGWQDPFSQQKFTKRQRSVAAINGLGTIYTPQFVLNGRDFRSWSRWRRANEAIDRINATEPQAHIRMTLRYSVPDRLEISGETVVSDAARGRGTNTYVVIYENELTRAVRAGENAGRTLHHDFVAREFIGPLRTTSETGAHLRQRLRLPKHWKAEELGVVVFIQDRRSGDILQALAMPLCTS